MGEVELGVAEPWWWGGVPVVVVEFLDVEDFLVAGVFVASFGPFVADGESVGDEGVFVSAPHVGGWVVLPAFLWVGEGVEDLEGFDSLFAEALAV